MVGTKIRIESRMLHKLYLKIPKYIKYIKILSKHKKEVNKHITRSPMQWVKVNWSLLSTDLDGTFISVEYRRVGGSAWGSSGYFYYISWYFHFQVKCFCSKTQGGVWFSCVYVEERKMWLGAIKQMNLRSRSLKWGPNKRAWYAAGLIKIGAVVPTNSNPHSKPSEGQVGKVWI